MHQLYIIIIIASLCGSNGVVAMDQLAARFSAICRLEITLEPYIIDGKLPHERFLLGVDLPCTPEEAKDQAFIKFCTDSIRSQIKKDHASQSNLYPTLMNSIRRGEGNAQIEKINAEINHMIAIAAEEFYAEKEKKAGAQN